MDEFIDYIESSPHLFNEPYRIPFLRYISLWQHLDTVNTIIIAESPYKDDILTYYGSAFAYRAPYITPTVQVMATALRITHSIDEEDTIRCMSNSWSLLHHGIIFTNSRFTGHITHMSNEDAVVQQKALFELIDKSNNQITVIGMGDYGSRDAGDISSHYRQSSKKIKMMKCPHPVTFAYRNMMYNTTLQSPQVEQVLADIVNTHRVDHIHHILDDPEEYPFYIMPPKPTALPNKVVADNIAEELMAYAESVADMIADLEGKNPSEMTKEDIFEVQIAILRKMYDTTVKFAGRMQKVTSVVAKGQLGTQETQPSQSFTPQTVTAGLNPVVKDKKPTEATIIPKPTGKVIGKKTSSVSGSSTNSPITSSPRPDAIEVKSPAPGKLISVATSSLSYEAQIVDDTEDQNAELTNAAMTSPSLTKMFANSPVTPAGKVIGKARNITPIASSPPLSSRATTSSSSTNNVQTTPHASSSEEEDFKKWVSKIAEELIKASRPVGQVIKRNSPAVINILNDAYILYGEKSCEEAIFKGTGAAVSTFQDMQALLPKSK